MSSFRFISQSAPRNSRGFSRLLALMVTSLMCLHASGADATAPESNRPQAKPKPSVIDLTPKAGSPRGDENLQQPPPEVLSPSASIMRERVFDEPIRWVGRKEPTDADSLELWNTILRIRNSFDREELEDFIKRNPDSGWTPSLRANLALVYRHEGRNTKALAHWEAAWEATRAMKAENAAVVADSVMGHWGKLLASLGETERLQSLVKEMKGRDPKDMRSRSMQGQMVAALRMMKAHPGDSFRCGTLALFNVAGRKGVEDSRRSAVLNVPSPTNGFNMDQLVEFSSSNRLGLVAVKRREGSPIVVPSVVHWKLDHYAAIISQKGDMYEVLDPTFENRSKWIARDVLEEEASAEFLVPQDQKPQDWTPLTKTEARLIRGKGYYNNIDDNKDEGCDHGDKCASCDGMPVWWVTEPYISLWLADRPLFYQTSYGETMGFQLAYNQREIPFRESPVINRPFYNDLANSLWSHNWLCYIDVSDPLVRQTLSLHLRMGRMSSGEPFWWQPPTPDPYPVPIGGEALLSWPVVGSVTNEVIVSFGQGMALSQGEHWDLRRQTLSDGRKRYYVVMPENKWHPNWDEFGVCRPWSDAVLLSTEQLANTGLVPGMIFGYPRSDWERFEATVMLPGGGRRVYSNASDSGSAKHERSGTRIDALAKPGDELSGPFKGRYGFRITHPDGAIELYNQVVISTSLLSRDRAIAYLTSRTDAQGRVTRFLYETNSGLIRLSKLVDADSKTNVLVYGNSPFKNLVTSVQDPYGHVANIEYDQDGSIKKITDAAGIISEFTYSSSFIQTLRTPYGTTTFQTYENPTPDEVIPDTEGQTSGPVGGLDIVDRAIQVTGPTQGKDIYVYQYRNIQTFGSFLQADGTHANHVDQLQSPCPQGIGFSEGSAPCVDNLLGSLDVLSFLGDHEHSGHVNRNSYHWDPRQSASLSSSAEFPFQGAHHLTVEDFDKARVRHWLSEQNSQWLSDSLSFELSPPDSSTLGHVGAVTWYDYAGKPPRNVELGAGGVFWHMAGANSRPSLILRVLPNGENHYEQIHYTEIGKPDWVKSTYTKPDGTRGVRQDRFEYSSPDGFRLLRHYKMDEDSSPAVEKLFMEYTYDPAPWPVLRTIRKVGDTPAEDETTTFDYDQSQRLTHIVRPTGLITQMNLQGDGRLQERVDFEMVQGAAQILATRNYTWEAARVKTVRDERGLLRTLTWDGLGRITKVEYPTGLPELYSYDLPAADPNLGNGTGQLKLLGLTSYKDRLGRETKFRYDGLQRLKTRTDARNNTTTYDYCDCGAVGSITEPPVAGATPASDVTTFGYDELGHRTSVSFPGGKTRKFAYNILGQMTDVLDHAGNAVLKYEYNNQGLRTKVSKRVGDGSPPPFDQVEKVIFDGRDQPIKLERSDKASVALAYDALGRLKQRTTTPLGAAPTIGVELFTYTARGLTNYIDELNRKTVFDRDAYGRVTAVRNPEQEVTRYTYTAAGDIATLTDGRNQRTTWIYDAEGRVKEKRDHFNAVVAHYEYLDTGLVWKRYDALGRLTTYTYDEVGNLTGTTYANGSAPSVGLVWDEANRLRQMTDGLGTTLLGYSNGLLASEDGPWATDTVGYFYNDDRQRQTLTVQRPGRGEWSQSYNYDYGKRLTQIVGESGTFDYGYRRADNSMSPASMVRRIGLPGGVVKLDYDGAGRLGETRLENLAGTVALNKHHYDYNARHERVKATFKDENYVDYTYYPDGQLHLATGKESGGTARLHEKFEYGYDASGNLSTRKADQLDQALVSDPLNRLVRLTQSGQVTASGMVENGVAPVTATASGGVVYQDGSFVQAGLSLGGGVSFTGTDNAGKTGRRMMSLALAPEVGFVHDALGNLVSDGQRSYSYDGENRLTSIQVPGVWRTEFVYDGLGRRRVRRDLVPAGSSWSTAGEVRYVYDGMLAVQERDGANTVLFTYTRGLDLSGSLEGAGGIGGLLARTTGSFASPESVYYHADGGGNVTALLDTGGSVVGRYAYDPFGNLQGMSGPRAAGNLYRFSSKEMDDRTGLYYYGYRFFDTSLQRWLNRDPIGERGGINLYQFVGNDPINEVDPYGLESFLFPPQYAQSPEFREGFNRGMAQPVVDFGGFYNRYIDPEPPEGFYLAEVPSLRSGARLFRGVSGVYKVCLKSGEKYIGKSIDIYRRLKEHVYRKKWKWEDIKQLFVEQENNAAKLSRRELEKVLEETKGQHPKNFENLLNEILPPQ